MANETLLILGIILTAIGAFAGILSLIIYKIKKIKLWAKYDREYGISE